MKYCEQCGSRLEDDARFCSYCGAEQHGLNDEVWSASLASDDPPDYGNTSGFDRYENRANKMDYAGPDGFQTDSGGKGRKPRSAGFIVFAVLFVVLLAGGSVFGYAMLDRNGFFDERKDFEELEEALTYVEPADLRFVSADVSEFPDVKMYVSCEKEESILTLTSPTARIREVIAGGAEIERTVKKVEQLEDNQGIGIELLTDKSGSMEYDMLTMQNVMTDFIDHMDYEAGDKAEIISFDSYIMYMCDYTGEKDRLKNGIANMTAYGETALYDALVAGIQNAGSRTGANCVIAFTDGADNCSYHTYEEAVYLAQQKSIPVYIIGTSLADQYILQEITSQTGGKYWSVSDLYDVGEIYDEIYDLQKDMYCIEYETDENSDAYAERIISCILKDREHGSVFRGVNFIPAEKIDTVKHSVRYEIIREDISWTQANEKAHAAGGHLVTITSASEEQEIENMAANAGIKFVWIGGYTSVKDGMVYGHWTTGEDFGYSNWYPGEPSRNDHDGVPEFYLMLWCPEGVWSWNDQRDDVVNSGLKYFAGNVGYVIEYEN